MCERDLHAIEEASPLVVEFRVTAVTLASALLFRFGAGAQVPKESPACFAQEPAGTR